MKYKRLFYIFMIFQICSIASTAADVNELTRGGWNCGAKWCYFFEADGTCDVVGPSTVTMKWSVEPDGSLILSDADGNKEYVKITGSSIHWRDGRHGYHRPFAEKSNEISLRHGRDFSDLTWRAPHSANALAEKLYLKSWISDSKEASMTFFSTDTCVVSNLKNLNINQKYLWSTLDAERVRLTSMIPPFESKIVKVKMHPDAFYITNNDTTVHFVLNAYHKTEALAATLDMCYFPLGCYGFFTESTDKVLSYFDRTFPDPEGVADYSINIVGHRWTCDGVIVTDDERSITYINFPGDNTAIDKSFQYMTTILNNLFSPDDSTISEKVRIFIDHSIGAHDGLLITLRKEVFSDNNDDNQKKGFVSIIISLN